jgi:hypothetical protein
VPHCPLVAHALPIGKRCDVLVDGVHPPAANATTIAVPHATPTRAARARHTPTATRAPATITAPTSAG